MAPRRSDINGFHKGGGPMKVQSFAFAQQVSLPSVVRMLPNIPC